MSRGSQSVYILTSVNYISIAKQMHNKLNLCLQLRHSSPALARPFIPNAPEERCKQTQRQQTTWDEKGENLDKVKTKSLSFLQEEI